MGLYRAIPKDEKMSQCTGVLFIRAVHLSESGTNLSLEDTRTHLPSLTHKLCSPTFTLEKKRSSTKWVPSDNLPILLYEPMLYGLNPEGVFSHEGLVK